MQYQVAGGICAPKGFAAAGVHCGIRANHAEKYDLALIKADVRCAPPVYTTNKVAAHPQGGPCPPGGRLRTGDHQNSGNANTCAANGVALAEECCELVGKELGIDLQDVLPASTGVIGQPMVIDPFARIPAAAAKLAADEQGSTDAATGTRPPTPTKRNTPSVELGGTARWVPLQRQRYDRPQHGHHVAFYTTDVAVSPILLKKALKTVVPGTYNQMSVDLDTSTNDTLIIMASGLAGNPEICEENADYEAFVAAHRHCRAHVCRARR
ncbi:MAG: bifunctional ornithine acetyltransferase/N-acetylglutamate synthase [Blautia massiliensis (ex Durand et al. 2017)]